jgi:hypothetical protein
VLLDRLPTIRSGRGRTHKAVNDTVVLTMNTNTRPRHPGEGSKALSRLPQSADPLLQFDLQKELQDLRGQDSWQRETGRSSKTLAKSHRAEGRVSIHPLLGTICILPDQKVDLSADQLLVMDYGVLHNVEALERVPSCSPPLGREAYRNPDATCSESATDQIFV